MKNLQTLEKQLRICTLIKYLATGIISIGVILIIIGAYTKIATAGALALIASIPTLLISNKLIKNKKRIIEEFKILTLSKSNIEKWNSSTYEIGCSSIKQDKNQYTTKSSYTTECENKFYKILKDNFSNEYEIHPQIPLSSIIKKHKTFENQYQGELYRVIDFGIFSKDSLKPLLLIEINDKTHKTKERRERDNKVKEICESANIELMTFWTEYSNTKEYIINRIKSSLDYKA